MTTGKFQKCYGGLTSSETFQTGAECQQQDLKSDRVFGELKDSDESDDAKEGERRARLGPSATHRC